MGKHNKTPQGAKLSSSQKAELVQAIYAQWPNLKAFSSDIEALVQLYSEQDKDICKRLLQASSASMMVKEEADGPLGQVTTLSPGDEGYAELLSSFEKARAEDDARRELLAAQAQEEMAARSQNSDVVVKAA